MTAPRRGLVLGAGGILGFSWMLGALRALEEDGVDPLSADVIIGTSAGSIMSSLLSVGGTVEQIIRHQYGIQHENDFELDFDYDVDPGGSLPPRPGFGLGSMHLLVNSVRHPRQMTPLGALSSLLPPGKGTLEPLGRAIEKVTRHALGSSKTWPERQTWLVAMDYDTGRRVAFGRPGSPRAPLWDAVMASCSVPGWFQPTEIGERRYIDGGACSSTSADLLAGWEMDEVYVFAPMASFAVDDANSVASRVERRFRKTVTKRLMGEAEKVRRLGSRVVMLGPGPQDLKAIGANLMDPRRRLRVLETSLQTSRQALGSPAAVDQVSI